MTESTELTAPTAPTAPTELPLPLPPPTPRPTPWPTVVFDLDGTLADTVELIVESYQHAFRTVMGQEEDAAVIRSWIGRPLLAAFQAHAPRHADALYAEYLRWNAANTERLIRGYAGIREVLAELATAGLRLGVATSKRRESARQATQLLGLAGYLPVLVALEDTEVHKPEPAPLLLAVERLGGDPGRAAYVGDAVVDVLAGKAAGMSTVAVTWGAGRADALAAAEPDAMAADAAELRRILLPDG
ncbi:MAG TPA: HAD-IA family hydrolase [Intrasporangium sp.]|uniref:HAD family hydrolase n=1 Tax=Intrasporangium sp. TaxID=1925024 RepID=UPI002D776D85|nr:HAD-IA family hydrolase [Intrasporangium sp.]HET7399963.1 HAD-IA family hydrolase [Intrasporangium sp.]